MLYLRKSENAIKGLVDLINYIPDAKNKVMLEVGSHIGESTAQFLKVFKTVFCVDTWRTLEYEKEFEKTARKYKNIFYYKCKNEDLAKICENEYFDFIYIDACHLYEEVKKDIKNWLPKIKKTGYIGGHDYHSGYGDFAGLIKAVNEYKIPDKIFLDSSWIIKI